MTTTTHRLNDRQLVLLATAVQRADGSLLPPSDTLKAEWLQTYEGTPQGRQFGQVVVFRKQSFGCVFHAMQSARCSLSKM